MSDCMPRIVQLVERCGGLLNAGLIVFGFCLGMTARNRPDARVGDGSAAAQCADHQRPGAPGPQHHHHPIHHHADAVGPVPRSRHHL